jgi:hypothetical protein
MVDCSLFVFATVFQKEKQEEGLAASTAAREGRKLCFDRPSAIFFSIQTPACLLSSTEEIRSILRDL